MCYSILSLIPMKKCVFMVRERTSSSFLMVIFHLEMRSYSCTLVNLKFLCQRLLEKFVPWEDGSSSTVEVKNKKRRKVKRTAVSDAVSNEDVHVKNVKKNLSDVKRQNLEFKPPQRVVGMCKYLVNCTLEPSASQFDPLKEVFP